jgi:aspartate aminotransferase
MIPVASHILRMTPSPTLEIKEIADGRLREGKPVYNFGIGELNPEIPTPPEFVEEIVESLRRNENHYSDSAGDRELREALCEDFKTFGLDYPASQVVVCPGPKDALFKTALALLDPRAERNRVIAFAPLYESFEQIPFIVTGVRPIILDCDRELLPDLNQLEDVLKRDKSIAAIIINSPNNPSGALYPQSFFRELATLLAPYGKVNVISDEVYRTVRYDGEPYTSIAKELPERTLFIGGISKELSATGLRLGYVAAPSPIIEAIRDIEGNTSSCVHLPTQKGYARFLRKDRDHAVRHRIRDALETRRNRFIELFAKAMPRAVLPRPKGAFYAFPDVTGYLARAGNKDGGGSPAGAGARAGSGDRAGTGRRAPGPRQPFADDRELARYLLTEAGVVCLPGSTFHRPGYLRFAYALPFETIEEGMGRLAKVMGG